MNCLKQQLRKELSSQLPLSCEYVRRQEKDLARYRNKEIAEEEEKLLWDDQIKMRHIKSDKKRMDKLANSVVNEKLEFSDVEKIHTLLSKRSEMDPNDFWEGYETLIYPYFKMEEWTHTPDEICNFLYPAICKRMDEESSQYSMW